MSRNCTRGPQELWSSGGVSPHARPSLAVRGLTRGRKINWRGLCYSFLPSSLSLSVVTCKNNPKRNSSWFFFHCFRICFSPFSFSYLLHPCKFCFVFFCFRWPVAWPRTAGLWALLGCCCRWPRCGDGSNCWAGRLREGRGSRGTKPCLSFFVRAWGRRLVCFAESERVMFFITGEVSRERGEMEGNREDWKWQGEGRMAGPSLGEEAPDSKPQGRGLPSIFLDGGGQLSLGGEGAAAGFAVRKRVRFLAGENGRLWEMTVGRLCAEKKGKWWWRGRGAAAPCIWV
jgi:hypothetical protein